MSHGKKEGCMEKIWKSLSSDLCGENWKSQPVGWLNPFQGKNSIYSEQGWQNSIIFQSCKPNVFETLWYKFHYDQIIIELVRGKSVKWLVFLTPCSSSSKPNQTLIFSIIIYTFFVQKRNFTVYKKLGDWGPKMFYFRKKPNNSNFFTGSLRVKIQIIAELYLLIT